MSRLFVIILAAISLLLGYLILMTMRSVQLENFPKETLSNNNRIKHSSDDIIGELDEDDPRLIEIIKKWFLEQPSDVPYKFSVQIPDTKGQIGVPAIVDNLLGQKRNGFFIECGAYDGESISNSLFFELNRNWTGLLIEANYMMFTNLKQKNRKAYSINACLTGKKKAERMEFKNAGVFGGISEINITDKSLQEYQNSYYTGTSKVSCFPLYSILLAVGNPTVDYFSLDIEGGEWVVVKSLPWAKVNINIISLENAHLGSDYPILEQFMIDQGYEVKQKVEFDTLFVKKNFDG